MPVLIIPPVNRSRRLITPVNITAGHVELLHADILDIMGRDSIITPDDLRGDAPSLKAALLGDGKCAI